MKVLIPNATNSRNIGDQAALGVLLRVVKDNLPKASIAVHTSQPEWYSQQPVEEVRDTIYSWVLFPSENILSRIFKLIAVLCLLALWLSGIRIRTYTALDSILKDYLEADIILFCGGGYLRSKPGLKESLNLLLLALPFLFAKNVRAKKIIAPTGFGPFAASWQARLFASLLKKVCNIIMVRESISIEHLRSLGVVNVNESCDLALLEVPSSLSVVENTPPILGLTIRNWLPEQEQNLFERKVANALDGLAQSDEYILQPIVQVQAPEFGDDDLTAVQRVVANIKNKAVHIEPVIVLHDVAHAQDVYSRLDAILGMRMHSNIIAATQGVPFVAIAYEYKTQGIAEMLGMSKYCMPCSTLGQTQLSEMITEVLRNKKQLRSVILDRLAKIRETEERRWQEILHELR